MFAISWKNPDASDRNLSLDDYRRLGLMPAIDAVADIAGAVSMHAVGYCLGGLRVQLAGHDDDPAGMR